MREVLHQGLIGIVILCSASLSLAMERFEENIAREQENISKKLIDAVLRETEQRVSTLLSRVSDTKDRASLSSRALIEAARYGRNNMVLLLLQHGANPNLLDYAEATPLGLAALNRHNDILLTLLQHGASPHLKNNYKEAPLKVVASITGDSEAIVMLLQYGAKVDYGKCSSKIKDRIETSIKGALAFSTSLAHAIAFDSIETLSNQLSAIPQTVVDTDKDAQGCCNMDQLLVSKNYSGVNHVGEDGWTALHWAAAQNNTQAIKLLLCYGANPFIITKPEPGKAEGLTAVQIAARNGYKRAANTLVAYMRLNFHSTLLNLLGQQIEGFAPELQKQILNMLSSGECKPFDWKFPKRNNGDP